MTFDGLAIARIQPSTVVTVPIAGICYQHGGSTGARGLWGAFIVSAPLTKSQLNRLPKSLKALL